MFTNGRCPHDIPTSNCRFHLLAPKRALASTAADRACTRRPPRDCIPNPVARFGSLPRFTREGRLQGLTPLISPLRVAAIAGNISPVTPSHGLCSPSRSSYTCRSGLASATAALQTLPPLARLPPQQLAPPLRTSSPVRPRAHLPLRSTRPGIPNRLVSTGLSPVSAPQPGL